MSEVNADAIVFSSSIVVHWIIFRVEASSLRVELGSTSEGTCTVRGDFTTQEAMAAKSSNAHLMEPIAWPVCMALSTILRGVGAPL